MKKNIYAANCITVTTPLIDVCKIVVDTPELVLLEFDADPIKLISTGVLNGDERYYRITKANNKCSKIYNTVIYTNGERMNFDYGGSGETCISAGVRNRKEAIVTMLNNLGYNNIF